ncbi:MAG: MBL fold metallo-hydrolase [Lachnospiraceae bacterium]|nr:MBL fold metallo-hydrolase [Lachnospiraceae bacterium]
MTGTFNNNGKTAIWWLGQMGLMVYIGGKTLCFDYYASPSNHRRVDPPVSAEELTGIDAFIGTHDHLDHIDHDSWKIWAKTNPKAKFIFPRKHIDTVLADGVDEKNAIGLNAGESYKIGDATIHAIAASHEFLDRDPKTGLYPYLQYIIEGDGIRIHHAGDTLRYEGMLPAITAFGRINVQLLPINGRDAKRYLRNCIGNMTYQEAADLAGETGPDLVIPGHWDMFEDNSADPNEFADYIKAKYQDRILCRIPRIMEKIEL